MRFLLKKYRCLFLQVWDCLVWRRKLLPGCCRTSFLNSRPQSKSSLERARIWSRVCLYFRRLPCLGLVSTNALVARRFAELRSQCQKYAHRESGRGVPEGEEYTAVFEWR